MFNFFQKRRERRDAELAAQRAHELALIEAQTRQLEVVMEQGATQARESASALIEIAKSNSAQAAAFTTWIQSFQITSAPTTSVVREEDEVAAEIARQYGSEIDPAGIPSELPEELRLAFALRAKFAADMAAEPLA